MLTPTHSTYSSLVAHGTVYYMYTLSRVGTTRAGQSLSAF